MIDPFSLAEGVKGFAAAAKGVISSDLYAKILELQQMALAMGEDNLRYAKRNAELEEALKVKGEVEYHYAVYWRMLPGGSGLEGPFSPIKWDGERMLARLAPQATESKVYFRFRCEMTNHSYTVPVDFFEKYNVRNRDQLPKPMDPKPKGRGGYSF